LPVQIDVIETPSLGDRSYLVSDGGFAVVIDPQRDIDRVLSLATDRGGISHVLETHIHNDYVTGGLELARAVGANYVVPAGDQVAYERVPATDGDVLEAGPMRFRVVHTPGHTHHHVSYVLTDADGAVQAVFTGGSMLYGATGRTDLFGAEHTHELTHAQYHSVRRLAAELPDGTAVFPTHGFGSFCSATPTSGDSSTVGEQLRVNPALTQDEQAFADQLIAGLGAYPAYYARMGPTNSAGPEPVDVSAPRPVDPDELGRRLSAGEWVVDLRARTAFAAGHLPGTLNFELSNNFVTYLGWLYDWGAPLTLIGETTEQVSDARRELVRIGIDRLAGAAVGTPEELAGDRPLESYPVTDFTGLAQAMSANEHLTVLDARRDDERASGGVRSSLHIPIHELAGRIDELPAGEIWVYCGSGYRASIAASLIARADRRPVLVDGAYDDADTGSASAGLHAQPTSV
jgi:hydroxyacylglutathione hydrolase